MQTFFKRLTQIIDYQGFKNLNDFALNGLKYDSSSKLNRLKDEKNKPSVEILLDISNKFQNINLHWLITGKGEMIIGNKEIPIATVEEQKPTYGKEQKTDIDLLVKNNLLLKEQNQLQEEIITMLKDKLQFTEEKLQQCQQDKNISQVTR